MKNHWKNYKKNGKIVENNEKSKKTSNFKEKVII